MKAQINNLKVVQAKEADVYRDIIRIPEIHRKDEKGNTIPEGKVCKVTVRSKSTFALIRGDYDETKRQVRIDERLRNKLNINLDDTVIMKIKTVCLWGSFRWACDASDPAYRVMAFMAILSIGLGAIGVMLGVISFSTTIRTCIENMCK